MSTDDQSIGVSRALLLSLVFAASVARADVVVEVADDAPFTRDQLRDALRVRLGDRGGSVRVRRTVHGVAITAGTGERDVPLGERAGADAARVVALAAVDLLLPDLATPPDELLHIQPNPTPAQPRSFTIGAYAGASMWSGALAGASLDLTLPFAEHGLLALEIGGGKLVSSRLDLTTGLMRASAGVRVGALELRGGVTLVPLSVADGVGDTTVLAGVGAGLAPIPVARKLGSGARGRRRRIRHADRLHARRRDRVDAVVRTVAGGRPGDQAVSHALALLATALATDDHAARRRRCRPRVDRAAPRRRSRRVPRDLPRARRRGVYRRLARVSRPIPEREDLAQDVFLGVHRALPRFRGDAALGTLIQRIAINVACDFLRRRMRKPASSVDPAFFDELVGAQRFRRKEQPRNAKTVRTCSRPREDQAEEADRAVAARRRQARVRRHRGPRRGHTRCGREAHCNTHSASSTPARERPR